jgi:hypothetical protein
MTKYLPKLGQGPTKTLAKEPRGKMNKWIKHLSKLTREEGRNKP